MGINSGKIAFAVQGKGGTVRRALGVGAAVSLCLCTVLVLGLASPGVIRRHYTWEFNGESWTWNLSFNEDAYHFFKSLPRIKNYALYATNPYDDEYLEVVVNALKQAAQKEGFSERETVDFVISFVQHMPYTSDSFSAGYDEYPRYPIETLIEGGDCEDTSILVAALLRQMGYDVVLLIFSNHVAVGVYCLGCYGTYWEYRGRRYFYLETTAPGWEIGQAPPQYQRASARIEPLEDRSYLWWLWQRFKQFFGL